MRVEAYWRRKRAWVPVQPVSGPGWPWVPELPRLAPTGPGRVGLGRQGRCPVAAKASGHAG